MKEDPRATEIWELQKRLAARETMLRSTACLLMALGTGTPLPLSTCSVAARRILDALDPQRGKAAGR